MTRIRFIQIALLTLALLSGIYLYNSIERYEERVESDDARKAMRTPFLVAEKFMQSRQVELQRLSNYRRLFSAAEDSISPTFNDSIVLTDAEVALSQSLAEQITTWVEAGGNLVLSVNSSDQGRDFLRANALLQQLDIGVDWPVSEGPWPPSELQLTDSQGHPFVIATNTRYRLLLPDNDTVTYTTADEAGYVFAQMKLGEGLISVITDITIWSNQAIQQHQHGFLLALLLDNSDRVYWFQPKELPHWLALLYRHFPIFVCLCMLGIGLSVWHLASRMGAINEPLQAPSSGFSAHINASGEYYWRMAQQQLLIDNLRHQITQHLLLQWPSAKPVDKHRQVQILAKLSGWPKTTIEQLLFAPIEHSEKQFTSWVQGLQRLRNLL